MVVDALAKHIPDVIIVAARGIADGRVLAATLMLGGEEVLMDSRFWATTQEALIDPNAQVRVVAASGDGTLDISPGDMDIISGDTSL
jgi:nitronate monooxygenase